MTLMHFCPKFTNCTKLTIMQQEEIAQINETLTFRGLKSSLLNRIRIQRPTISRDTIYRAFKIEDWHQASPTLRNIVLEGKKIIAEDDIRVAAFQLSMIEGD